MNINIFKRRNQDAKAVVVNHAPSGTPSSSENYRVVVERTSVNYGTWKVYKGEEEIGINIFRVRDPSDRDAVGLAAAWQFIIDHKLHGKLQAFDCVSYVVRVNVFDEAVDSETDL